MPIGNVKSYIAPTSIIIVMAMLFIASFSASNFILFVLAVLLINMLWASATWAIFFQAGQTLFAVVVIAGIAGYTTGLFGRIIPNNWVTIPIALVVSCGIGMFFCALANRVRGHIQFAILNLACIFMFRYIIIAFTKSYIVLDC